MADTPSGCPGDPAASRLESVLRAAGIGLWDLDVAGDEPSWDVGSPGRLGVPVQSPPGPSGDDVGRMHPDDVATVREVVADVVEAGGAVDVEFRVVGRDDAVRWFSLRGQALVDESGRVRRLVGASVDVTRVRQALRARAGDAADAADAADAGRLAALVAQRLRLQARASDLLSRSLNEDDVLQQLAALLVPEYADWLVVLLPDGRGNLAPRVSAHAHAARTALALQALTASAIPLSGTAPAAEVFRTGRSLYTENVRTYLDEGTSPHDVAALMRELHAEAGLLLPMVVRGRAIGVLSLVNTAGRGPEHLGADAELFADLARRIGVALDNAHLYGQRARVAAELQRSLLPAELPDVPGVDVAVRYATPGEMVEVGGDFYDLVPVGAREYFVVVGDVSGRGIDAAGVTGLARHTLRAVASDSSPAQALTRLNEALLAQRPSERFLTAACARIALHVDGRALVTLARGGHTRPLLLRGNGSAAFMDPAGSLLGVFADIELEEAHETLLPGDSLVLYTDGITEARGDDGLFGEERLSAAAGSAFLRRDVDGNKAAAVADAILSAVQEYRTGPAEDDVALLVWHLRESH